MTTITKNGLAQQALLSGDHAIAYGVKLARAQVVPVYPITPQTPILEKLSELVAHRECDADIMTVESEHSSMSACIGAAVAGARVFTATACQGLALMHEMLHFAAGSRLPIVLANVNRTLAAPWGFWADQTDSLAQRDTGWLQFYAASPQEALDTVLQAYRVAETVSLPAMVVIEAVYVSHSYEPVELPDQAIVDRYLPPFRPKLRLDVADPHVFGGTVTPKQYAAFRQDIHRAMERAKTVVAEAGAEYATLTGRRYDVVEPYRCEDADIILVSACGIASTARATVDRLRHEGVRVGVLRVRLFRPFPAEAVATALAPARKVLVLDRNYSPGNGGIFCQETKAALYNLARQPAPPVFGFLSGVGGTNVSPDLIEQAVRFTIQHDRPTENAIWIE